MYFLFIAIHFLLIKPQAHDIQVAIFTLFESSEVLQLEVDIELKDLVNELQIPKEDISKQVLEDYLNQHLEFQFDTKKASIAIHQFELKAKHLTINAKFENAHLSFHSLTIKNTCLLSLEDHSNIIEIRVQNQERDFLMNKERTSIQVSL